MASKRVKLCLDALPLRWRDTTVPWRWAPRSNVPQRRHITVEVPASTGTIGTEAPITPQGAPVVVTGTDLPEYRYTFPIVSSVPLHIRPPTATTTLYEFPTLEPIRFVQYPHNHLSLPLRKDLLHRAVVWEGDASRQGTAATKYKHEVHGSKRKLRPQKGTGQARLGNRKSPMLRGGGRAFAKKARDFSTGLPRKLYDIAWRTALSYRYGRGELVVVDSFAVDGGAELGATPLRAQSWVEQVFPRLGWEKKGGGSLLLAALGKYKDTEDQKPGIFRGLETSRGWGRGLLVDDVDVKDLLMGERVVVEHAALDWMLRRHQSDLVKRVWSSA